MITPENCRIGEYIREFRAQTLPVSEEQKRRIDCLYETGMLERKDFAGLIEEREETSAAYIAAKARERQREHFGTKVYLRGLIEFSNICASNCLYCGIRRDNAKAVRYRLGEEAILDCCRAGYGFGFRTFVLQSGEDPWWTDERICSLIQRIRGEFPDCAITLSIGEKTKESYRSYYEAGADRYLLRHETASPELYRRLHPPAQTLQDRIRCLHDLKEIGYQIGAGMMVEAPGQTTEDLVRDLFFLKELQPDMIGIGPFIPHSDTPFGNEKAGSVDLTLFLLSVLRLMFPKVLLPATTALGTVDPRGREKGILAGANVIMPNLSPGDVRGKYLLYDNKICTGDDPEKCSRCMELRMKSIGYAISEERGDAPGWSRRV
uniref:[FeFe] hydrogenase H-cluster radical SAM maturase HydE n=1 Tax=Eubacterium cellulosolvens TaxID=29322 RepID=UPI0009E081B4|nr:[FeFe] hydrogenase H-cluster radical SAM maturase HydE [[Eubacterium] cellulosolvens]